MTVTKARKPRRWIDPRVVIGVLLVAVSVLGVVGVLVVGNRTSIAYAAASTIAPGAVLTVDDLVPVEVGLGASTGAYLGSETVPQGEFVVTQAVQSGELVPRSLIGVADPSRTSIIVEIAGGLPTELAAGAAVELWSSQESSPGTYGAPVLISASAVVAKILPREGALSRSQADRVELLLPKSEIPTLLAVISNDARVALVPVFLGVEN
ncbi:hypothetical protein C5E07_02475 [Pseudoclavibacter sp. RFBJ3]|uniref:hypothetical protein n=1 Tax=unclassified Pseudoclavibacter TaxID=2615177 RepID=UPI000CE766A6|nr:MULTISPECIES: hypothetical protein [unclassified Pseudoclavibacter]PPF80793.1 hypothetical protein C5C12_15925 [Pseudoclavibacter sp. RFBJ5]PPF94301.1 hypothetical protein C5E07_02475 [Pseudoclavibacter sp. RFBJ3]PPF99408.1 hypothetical protein C5C19_04110 [Pseudoclavibacter sp. RFBH5]PPG25602.1 hypothetical protein C5E13_01175 [Pseudoclavibacter sp. RFBI4]